MCTLDSMYLILSDAAVFLQESSITADEGTNTSVCVEIELAGELLADIEVLFVALSGGAGAGEIPYNCRLLMKT